MFLREPEPEPASSVSAPEVWGPGLWGPFNVTVSTLFLLSPGPGAAAASHICL